MDYIQPINPELTRIVLYANTICNAKCKMCDIGQNKGKGIQKLLGNEKYLSEELSLPKEAFIEQGQFGCFFEAVIQMIIDNNELSVNSLDISDFAWNEIDFKEDYERAKQLFAEVHF